MEAFGLSCDAAASFPDSPSDVSLWLLPTGASSDISTCLGPGSVGVEDRDLWGEESGRAERAGLGARMIGTELGRTLSANEPRCVGELLLFAKDGSGGCSTTQTCCCPPLGGEEMLLVLLPLPCIVGELGPGSGLSGSFIFSANKKNDLVTWRTQTLKGVWKLVTSINALVRS